MLAAAPIVAAVSTWAVTSRPARRSRLYRLMSQVTAATAVAATASNASITTNQPDVRLTSHQGLPVAGGKARVTVTVDHRASSNRRQASHYYARSATVAPTAR